MTAAHCQAAPPALSFTTTPIREQGLSLPALLAGRDDVVSWLHQGRGLIGMGHALTIEARGPERIEELRSAWRATIGAAWWRDPLVRPGTGPVAMGTITFSPASRERSALIVPSVLIGHDTHGAWLTTVVPAGQPHPSPEAIMAALHPQQPGPQPRADSPGPQPGSLSEQDWCRAVLTVQERMRAGQADKVVLARDVVLPGPHPATGDLLARLAHSYPTCWTFAVDGMVGASPEMLLNLEGRRLFSRVLAGTARRNQGTPTQDLAHWLAGSAKNTREHALARASALEALEPLCSVVEGGEPFVLELPNVLHLATDITGVVAGDTGALSLLGALHPTAAVGGTPTAAATAIIEQVEGMDRGRYAGPVGWVDWHGEGQWCIALRSAQLPQGGSTASGETGIRVFGGCGIMPDSDPVDELAETQAKMRPILEALAAPTHSAHAAHATPSAHATHPAPR
nr:isochorismate synthase [Actinomyces slackii]